MTASIASCGSPDASDASDTLPAASGTVLGWGVKVSPGVATRFAHQSRQIVIVRLTTAMLVGDGERTASRSATWSGAGRAGATYASVRTRTMAELSFSANSSVEVVRDYPAFGMMALRVTRAHVDALAKMDSVQRIWDDASARADLVSSTTWTESAVLNGLGWQGQGTMVAVIDLTPRWWSGAFGTCPLMAAWTDDSPGCAIRRFRNFNFWPNAPDTAPENDPVTIATNNQHGSMVSSIVLGVAPQTELLNYNVGFWDTAAQGYRMRTTAVLSALADIHALAATYPIVAVNFSAGITRLDSSPCNDSAYYAPIQALWQDRGILVVASTGNDGHNRFLSEPSCVTPAVSVGAQYDTQFDTTSFGSCADTSPHPGQVVCFSNLNPGLDFLAPGAHVVAGGLIGHGTSAAAPHVTGGLAALQSRNLSQQGVFLSAPAAMRRLIIDADPTRHGGVTYKQLDLDGGPQWSIEAGFAGYLKEDPAAELPATPNQLTLTRSFSGVGWAIHGVYLHLEIIHPLAASIEGTLSSPAGTTVTFTLPQGPNFNAVLGRDHAPGLFLPMRGDPVDGIWTLALTDLGGSPTPGYYIKANLFVVEPGCVDLCGEPGYDCGDDSCGGTCGGCAAGEVCTSEAAGGLLDGDRHVCLSCTPDCTGVSCGDDGCGNRCGSPCDDGVFCNGEEDCIWNTSCTPPGSPGSRCPSDGVACTTDCNEAARQCNTLDPDYCLIGAVCRADGAVNPADSCQTCDPTNPTVWTFDADASCNDDDACTSGDTCDPGTRSCLGVAFTCELLDDDCNVGQCAAGACVADPLPDGTPCNDQSACTTDDVCSIGTCDGTTLDCTDGNPCTNDSCDPASGCINVPLPDDSICDDASACTTGDSCQAGACTGAAILCDDGNGCTADSCDPDIGCVFTPVMDGDACDDQNPRTENDMCAAGICGGSPIDGSGMDAGPVDASDTPTDGEGGCCYTGGGTGYPTGSTWLFVLLVLLSLRRPSRASRERRRGRPGPSSFVPTSSPRSFD